MATIQTRKPTADELRKVAQLRYLRDEAPNQTRYALREMKLDNYLERLMDDGVDPSDLTR